MAWSHFLLSGKRSEASLEKIFPNWWYCSGTNSCHVLFTLSVVSMASCCATVIFLIVVQTHTSSPGSHPGIDCTQLVLLGSSFFLIIHSPALDVEIVTASLRDPLVQLIFGSAASKNGYPRISSSVPMSATKNWWVDWRPPQSTVRVTPCTMSPIWFSVPSMFFTFLGLCSGLVMIPNWSMVLGCMKHSVAPVSNNATRSA